MAMKAKEFQTLAKALEKLTRHQRKLMAERLEKIGNAEAVNTLIESRASEMPACPKCHQHEKIAKWGTVSGLQRYRCAVCKTTFNALTGTPLARLRKKEKWLEYAKQMTEGTSVRKSAAACDVHRNTAFRWRHRFLALPDGLKAKSLVGIAEADETYFLESFKGKKRGMPRVAHKRGTKAKKPGTSDEQIPVLVARDRAGHTADFVLEAVDKEHVWIVLAPLLAEDSILCTDGSKTLTAVAESIGVTHHAVNLSAGIRVDGPWHVQNVNAYHSRLKGWMDRFHGVATHYLPNYLGWRRLIERAGPALSPTTLLSAALGIGRDQQLMVT
jgi:transposase-like protein